MLLLLPPSGFSTPLNMMLYRSSLMSGISMSKSPGPLRERLGTWAGAGAGAGARD